MTICHAYFTIKSATCDSPAKDGELTEMSVLAEKEKYSIVTLDIEGIEVMMKAASAMSATRFSVSCTQAPPF